MKGKFLLPALALGLIAPAVCAQNFSVRETLNARDGFQPRKSAVAPRALGKRTAGTPARSQYAYGDDINFVNQYGELELVIEEDFSLLTFGTEEKPDKYTVLTIDPASPDYTYPWWNFLPQYTHEPHWGTGGAYSAGGCLYFECVEMQDQAHVCTPPVKTDKYDGLVVFEFKAKSKEGAAQYNALLVEAAETNNMGPSWDNIDDSFLLPPIPYEWTTYRVLLRGGGPTSIYHLVAVGPGSCFIDDIKVYEINPIVGMPVCLPHSDYKGESFTAHWKPVEGADKYLLSVYEKDENTGTPMAYLMKDREVTGTEYEVTGAESGVTYYYSLKAVKGEAVSVGSLDMRVYDLAQPKMNAALLDGDFGYKASWDVVPGAEVYNYWALNTRTAEKDGEFIVTNEDFTDVRDADGELTHWTKENPEQYTYDLFYPREMKQQGWRLEHGAPYTDYVAVDAYWYMYNQGNSALISPEFDMSKDGGKFTVSADLAGEMWAGWDNEGNELYKVTQVCAGLFNWNDEKGDYDQVELIYPEKEVTEDWQNFSFNFTKGSERSVFGIFAVATLTNLYIDNLVVTQNYKAGEKLMEPFLYERWWGRDKEKTPVATEINVEVPAYATPGEIYHKVSAFSRQADKYGQSYDERESKYTPLEFVRDVKDDVKTVALAEGSVTLADGTVTILNPRSQEVKVVSLTGAVLFSGSAMSESYTLPQRGVYIVTVGKDSFKVVY